ncbi:MAG: hypothetical protein NTY09_11015 [bacterium]|nr:hypothetical protein [bacterium]
MSIFSNSLKEKAMEFTEPWGKPYLAYLSLEQGERWDQARAQVDKWFDDFPHGNKLDQIKRDFLLFENEPHIGAFFELATFYILKHLLIDVKPNNGEYEEYPDYFIDINGNTYCAEVTNIQLSDDEKRISNMFRELCSAIEIKCGNSTHRLGIQVKNFKFPIDGSYIKSFCDKLLNQLKRLPNGNNSLCGKTI